MYQRLNRGSRFPEARRIGRMLSTKYYFWTTRSAWQSVVCARRAALLAAEIDGQDCDAAEDAFVNHAIASYRRAKRFPREDEERQ